MAKHRTATLNITYNGLSADFPQPLDYDLSDREIKHMAVELVRSGGIPGLQIANLPWQTFDNYVIDRFDTSGGGKRLYLRPRVPFGGA